jgi:acetoin utilization protein AcuB
MPTSAKTVADYMTPCPRSIRKNQTMAEAHPLMRKWKVRHLPVLERRRLVGLVSLGDLHLIETLKDVDPSQVPVEDAMTPDPYTVTPDARLPAVAREMEARKLGSALVVRNGEILGIFSTTDALRALSELGARRRAASPKPSRRSGRR